MATKTIEVRASDVRVGDRIACRALGGEGALMGWQRVTEALSGSPRHRSIATEGDVCGVGVYGVEADDEMVEIAARA